MSNEMVSLKCLANILTRHDSFCTKKSGITSDMCPVFFKKAIACLDPLTVKLKHSWSSKVTIIVLVSR